MNLVDEITFASGRGARRAIVGVGCTDAPEQCIGLPSRFETATFVGQGVEGVAVAIDIQNARVERDPGVARMVEHVIGDTTFNIPERDAYDTAPTHPIFKIRNLCADWHITKADTIVREVIMGSIVDHYGQASLAAGSAATAEHHVAISPMIFVAGVRDWFLWVDAAQVEQKLYHIANSDNSQSVDCTNLFGPMLANKTRRRTLETTHLLRHSERARQYARAAHDFAARAATAPQARSEENKAELAALAHTAYQYLHWDVMEHLLVGAIIMRQPRVTIRQDDPRSKSLQSYLAENLSLFTVGESWRLKIIIVSMAHQLVLLQSTYGFVHGDMIATNAMISTHPPWQNAIWRQFSIRTSDSTGRQGTRQLDEHMMAAAFSSRVPHHVKLIDLGRAGIDQRTMSALNLPVGIVSDMVAGNTGADMRRFAGSLAWLCLDAWETGHVVAPDILRFCATMIIVPVSWGEVDNSLRIPRDRQVFSARSKTAGAFFDNIVILCEFFTLKSTQPRILPDDVQIAEVRQRIETFFSDLNEWTVFLLDILPFDPRHRQDHANPTAVVNHPQMTVPSAFLPRPAVP